jgi:hypothetical protein
MQPIAMVRAWFIAATELRPFSDCAQCYPARPVY